MEEFKSLFNRFVISCTGQDSEKFLQGLCTNDVRQKHFYSLMLTPKGKFLFDFFAYRVDFEHYLIDASNENLLVKMLTYKLRNQIVLQDLSCEYKVLHSNDAFENLVDGFAFQDPRNVAMGFRAIVRKTNDAKFDGSLEVYLKSKYQNAIPDGDLDMTTDKSFPLEFGLNQLNGVSHSKGCYLGQEAIARAHHTGVVRKNMHKVTAVEGQSLVGIQKGTEIFVDGEKIGSWCSGYKNLGIALIRTQSVPSSKIATLCGGKVSLELAPWYQKS